MAGWKIETARPFRCTLSLYIRNYRCHRHILASFPCAPMSHLHYQYQIFHHYYPSNHLIIYHLTLTPQTTPPHSPLPLTLHPTPSPTHCPNAPTTAPPSSLGTLIQQSRPSTLRISIGIAVPLRPRNCWRAEVRWARRVRMSGSGGARVEVERRVRWR